MSAVVDEWEQNDPIVRLENLLRQVGQLDDQAIAEIEREVKVQVDEAIEVAEAEDDASAHDLLTSVYSPKKSQPEPPPTGNRALGFIGAINEALDLELAADEKVIVMGEDIGKVGGIFRATVDLYARYGEDRIRDTPLSESAFVGCGVGAALTGLRPVVELQFSDFSAVAFDQLVNQAAKLRFMMGGAPTIPLTIRMVSGAGVRLGAQHSQSLEGVFAHFPGLIAVMPSNPYDAKGLLAAAIQDDNPVIFLEQKLLFFGKEEPVPDQRFALELAKANIVLQGTDATVIALGAMVPAAVRAARELEKEGISIEIVDPRTLVPLDSDTIMESVGRTNRALVVHEAVAFGGLGGEIAAQIGEKAFWNLDAPVARIGAPFHPIPYQKDLSDKPFPMCSRSSRLSSPCSMSKLTTQQCSPGSGVGSRL